MSVVGFYGRIRADVPTVAQVASRMGTSPMYPHTVEQYLEANPQAADMLRNRVRQCAQCRKPNGLTLLACNACGADLGSTPITFTPNVFMAFVLGIGKAPYPLTVSFRFQNESFIVMDDLLQLSPLHLNVIPTTAHIPDWRYLLRRPHEGLALISRMLTMCHDTAAEQFFRLGSEWARTWIRDVEKFSVARDMCAGFNYPPSQYQLHIQYICPVLMPFHQSQVLKGVHFTYLRFFPFDYVRRCLEAAVHSSSPPAELLDRDTDIVAITKYFADRHSIDYDAFHALFLRRFAQLSSTYSNFQREWFEGTVVPGLNGDGVLVRHEVAEGEDYLRKVHVQDVVQDDRMRLQCYGRPYDADGKPTGTYYGFPKVPADVERW